MGLTCKQAYVLDHLAQVRLKAYKLQVRCPRERFELHGWDCTTQITSLAIKGLIRQVEGGRYVRRREISASPMSAARPRTALC